MTQDPTSLAATLLKNFITVRFPPDNTLSRPVDWNLSPGAQMRCLEYATKADALAIGFRRQALRIALTNRGYRQFLDRLEADPHGGWRIHLFLVDSEAVAAVPQITDGIVGPGDPAKFDPRRWVERRMAQMVSIYERAGWWDWFGDALA